MKELNLKQMESVNGGLESDCKVKQTVYEKTISISYTCDLFDWVYHEFMLLHSNIWNFLFNAVYECNITFSCSNIAYI